MLDTPFRFQAGFEQADVASLVANGLHYECVVWNNLANLRIEAACYVQHAGGGRTLVFHNIVEQSSIEDAGETGGYPLDCPKIIAVGTTFVVHWLGATDATPVGEVSINDWALFRATMDMEDFDASVGGWEAQGSLAVFEGYALYDVAPLRGSDTDFVLARCITDAETIRVERYDGFGVIDTDWQEDLDVPIAGRVLAIYGHEADNDVIVTYERTDIEGEIEPYTLWSWHLDADDGDAAATDVQTFVDFAADPMLGTDGARYVQVGHERVAANQIAVVAEAQLVDLATTAATDGMAHAHIHHVAYRVINSSDASRFGNEHWIANAYMCSRPFAYASGSALSGAATPNLYVVLSYKSIYETNDWEQATIFACNLDFRLWQVFDSGAVRPRPICTLSSVGIPDARASGWHPSPGSLPDTDGDLEHVGGPVKRCNHVSYACAPPPYGPHVKTRSIAVGVFAGQSLVGIDTGDVDTDSDSQEFQPEGAGVQLFRVYLEDPATVYRDDLGPTQPIDNFRGAYPRSMCQTAEIGRSLFISGGTPYVYDGELLVESGFPYAPEIFLTEGYTDGSNYGGLEDGGIYQIYAVYSWRDAAGQIHRSGPSRIVTVDLDDGDTGFVVRVRTQTLSVKDSVVHYPLAQSIQIELFMTPESNNPNATIFYRIYASGRRIDGNPGGRTLKSDTPANDPLALFGFVDIPVGIPDAELVLQPQGPYQFDADLAGLVGPLPQVVPAFTACCTWLNRLWAADALDSSMIWYSDEIIPDPGSDYYAAPIFTEDQTFRIGEIGEITAMQAMNNTLIVFTASSIFALTATDVGGGLMQVQSELLHEGTGCLDARSIVLGPPGIFFQTAKGYYLLNRGRELDYVSAGLNAEDDFRAAGNIRGAALKEDEHEILVAANGRPRATTTWTFPATPEPASSFSIDFLIGAAVETETGADLTGPEVADNMAEAIAARFDVMALLDSVSSPSNTLVVVWKDGVVPAYTDTYSMGTFDGVDTYTTRPRTLVYNYLFRQWSRTEHPQTSTNTRGSEVMDCCVWRGLEGDYAHVVLTQSNILVQRAANDANAFSDETSVGLVGVPIDVESAWFHAAGIAGHQRVRNIEIIASKPQESQYNVDVAWTRDGDYDRPEFATGLAVQTISPARTRVFPPVPKAHAHRVRIYELPSIGGSENIRVTGLVFYVGLKKRTGNLSSTQIAS
jgi:hypothetical protein